MRRHIGWIGAALAVLTVVAVIGACSRGGEPDPSPSPVTTKRFVRARPARDPTATPTPSPSATQEPRPEPVLEFEGPSEEQAPLPPPPPAFGPPPPAPIEILHPPPYTVVIDPGHGGPRYSGAAAPGIIEKDANLDVALRLAPLLTAAGYRVVLTRRGDYTLTQFDADTAIERRDEIQARVDLANQERADILISVHFNGSSVSSLRGLEVYYNPDRSFGYFNYVLANSARHSIVTSIRGAGYDVVDRGIKNDALVGGDPNNPHSWILGTNSGFRPSMMPGVIVEALFMSNYLDVEQIKRPEMRQVIAEGYRSGIDAYFAWLQSQLPAPTATPTPTPTSTPTASPSVTPAPLPSDTPSPSAAPSPATPTPSPATSTTGTGRKPN